MRIARAHPVSAQEMVTMFPADRRPARELKVTKPSPGAALGTTEATKILNCKKDWTR